MTTHLPALRSRDAAAASFVAVGCLLLAARAWMIPLAGDARPLAGTLLFAALLAGALVVPVARDPSVVAGPPALGIGLVALVGAAIVAGRPVPFLVTAWTLPLSLVAAVAEEALFRRVAYAELARWGPVVAVIGSALLFAAVHLPLYGVAALPVDLGAGLVFGWQRWATGSWTAPAATHAAANLVAVLR